MQPTTNKDSIQAELRSQKEKRPYFVTRLRGVVAADDFKPELHGKIEAVFYPEGYIYQTSYRIPKQL